MNKNIKNVVLPIIYVMIGCIVLLGIMCAITLEQYNSVLSIVGGLIVFFLGRSLSKGRRTRKK